MSEFLIDVINHKFVFTLFVALLLATGFATLQNGIQAQDFVIWAIVVIGYSALWRILLTRRSPGINTVQAFTSALKNNQFPTLVEFYSSYCAGCMAVKPIVDQLEKDVSGRLQIIRLDIDSEPGKNLVRSYGVIFTPTFLYFDKTGERIRDSMFIVDRAKIMRDIGLE